MDDMNLEPEKSRSIKLLEETLLCLKISTREEEEQATEGDDDVDDENAGDNPEVGKLCSF